MRIGINAQVVHGHLTGVHYCIVDLIEALVRVDPVNEYVVYGARGGDLEAVAAAPNWTRRVGRFPGRVRVARVVWEQGLLPAIARRDGIDVLHCPAYMTPVFARVPVVATIPDVIALVHPEVCRPRNRAYFGALFPAVARRVRRIITVSEHSKREIMDRLGVEEGRIDVIPNGVHSRYTPVGAGDATVRARFGLPDRYLLFVGNIEPKKNVARLVEAYAILRERHGIPHRLVIAGNRGWSCADVFDAVGALGLRDDVVFTGYVPREDLPALYRLADVFVFPSLCEGFGLPPVEAMACGTPVVASTAAALAEVTAGAAVLVDPLSADAIAKGVMRVLGDEGLRRSLVAKGRERAGAFTWECAARETLETYERAYADGR